MTTDALQTLQDKNILKGNNINKSHKSFARFTYTRPVALAAMQAQKQCINIQEVMTHSLVVIDLSTHKINIFHLLPVILSTKDKEHMSEGVGDQDSETKQKLDLVTIVLSTDHRVVTKFDLNEFRT